VKILRKSPRTARLAAVAAAAAVGASTFVAVTSSPAFASSTGCSGSDPRVCISVVGTGLHVSSATVTGYFPSGGDYYLEMWSSDWYYSGDNLSYGPGTSATLPEYPNDNLPNNSGVCGTVTTYSGTRIVEACVTIHN
jgi:hypothetical protein